MSIATEIERLQTAKADIKAAIEEKGVTVGDGTIDTYAQKIGEISSGDYEQGYEDGYNKANNENPFYYATNMDFLFTRTAFSSEKSNIVCKVLNNTKWSTAFAQVSGIKTLKIICDTPDLEVNFQALVRECADLELLDLTEFKCYPTSIAYFAYQSKKLVTILGAMDLSKCTTVTLAFTSANALKDIEFVPNSIKISIGFNDSNLLSDISIQSIIDGLADLTGGTAQTLTLHATVGGKLTDEQKASITAKNWTLVY